MKGSPSDWNRSSIANPDSLPDFFLISSFLTGSLNASTSRTLWPGVEGKWRTWTLWWVRQRGWEERQRGELRRLICKNRIMLVHRIKRWAPCFLSAVTGGLHQEVAGVSQAAASAASEPSSPSTVAGGRGSHRALRSSSGANAKLKPRPQLPNALETSCDLTG